MHLAAVEFIGDTSALYCPLIDARRNEVFTAVYDFSLNTLLPPQPMIIEPDSFNIYLEVQRVLFFGSGHNKCGKIISHKNAVFRDVSYASGHIHKLALEAYANRLFADVAYTEPFYTKEFFSPG